MAVKFRLQKPNGHCYHNTVDNQNQMLAYVHSKMDVAQIKWRCSHPDWSAMVKDRDGDISLLWFEDDSLCAETQSDKEDTDGDGDEEDDPCYTVKPEEDTDKWYVIGFVVFALTVGILLAWLEYKGGTP